MKNILKTKNIYESTSKIALAKFLMRMFENYSDEMQFPPEVRVHNEWILEEIRS